MVLNLKTFQSFQQKPYCKSHVPKPAAQGVGADSAEMLRIKGVTSTISNLQYKSEYEKQKGDASGFAQAGVETPELKNSMKAASQISQVKYAHMAHDGPTGMA